MGQSTFATIGVSVSLPLIYRHIKLINKLCDITKLCVYVSGLSDEPDETVDFDIIEDFGLNLDSIYELAEKENEEEFIGGMPVQLEKGCLKEIIKQGKYYIIHFKELFALDGKPTDISENDLARRNAIAKLLEDWGLVTVVNKKQIETPEPIFLSQVKIISHKEKNDWELVAKYSIGKKKTV